MPSPSAWDALDEEDRCEMVATYVATQMMETWEDQEAIRQAHIDALAAEAKFKPRGRAR